jgi:hypothetical protein
VFFADSAFQYYHDLSRFIGIRQIITTCPDLSGFSNYHIITLIKMATKIKETLDGLDDQIIGIVGQHVRRRKAEYEKAALALKNQLRDDVVRFTEMLDAGKINKSDYELLVKGRYAQLKIELLAELSMSRAKFDLITADVVRLVVKTGINAASNA